MIPEVLYFYILAILLVGSAIGVIFAPRMYLSAVSLLCVTVFSSLLYLDLNASYAALFQFILCGLFLSVYIFLLLKRIGRLNLKLKLVTPFKILSSALLVTALGVLACLFFKEEFTNSLFDIFNFVNEKSSDVVNFASHVFPLHLVLILVLVSAAVIRIFLLSPQNSALVSDENLSDVSGEAK